MKLQAKIRTSIGTRDITAEAATYDLAKGRLDQQLEPGEYVLSFQRVDE